jgi:hypothetical protein
LFAVGTHRRINPATHIIAGSLLPFSARATREIGLRRPAENIEFLLNVHSLPPVMRPQTCLRIEESFEDALLWRQYIEQLFCCQAPATKEKQPPIFIDDCFSQSVPRIKNELGHHFHDIGGLRTLGAVFDCEFNLVAFIQGLVTLHLERGKVDEDVFAALARDKAKAFRRVKPLDRTLDTFCHTVATPLPGKKWKKEKLRK